MEINKNKLQISEQYNSSKNTIELYIKNFIDSEFIRDFVNEYRLLIRMRNEIGKTFTLKSKILKLIIDRRDFREDEDFDMLFISYINLFKIDFPMIEIEFHFINFKDEGLSASYAFKLAHHRTHLLINNGKPIFKIFKNGTEWNHIILSQSTSYIPPLIITSQSLTNLFAKKTEKTSFTNILLYVFKQIKNDPIIKSQKRTAVYEKIQETFVNNTPLENWKSEDLSTLYFINALKELYVLRHNLNLVNGIKNDYQIGNTIMISRDDKISVKKFIENVDSVLKINGVFEFSDVEAYIFSLIVQSSKLFRIPNSMQAMFNKVSLVVDENERNKFQNYSNNKNAEKYLKHKFIDIYTFNLQLVIDYTKDVVYGLQELAKNAVEHSGMVKGKGFGIISARIYSHSRIKSLKNVPSEWLSTYGSKHNFMDITVIDSGAASAIETYTKTLESELITLSKIEDTKVKLEMQDAYRKDIKQVKNFGFNNLFNFSSLQLIHQINRTKSRLGLLIFSQTILFEKGAFVSLASNNISEEDSTGFFIYKKELKIIDEPNLNYLNLGTNLNFIIPIKEELEYVKNQNLHDDNKSSSASSVFQELHNYSFENEAKNQIVELNPISSDEFLDKYSKLDSLKSEINLLKNQILLIDAEKIKNIIENSSDWVRFLAGLQFSSAGVKDIIVKNLNVDLYLEIINVLKIFNDVEEEGAGFWKKDRYILFFLPLTNNEGNIFWFNNLLCFKEYNEFLKINKDIDLYHQNLSRLNQDIIENVNINYLEIDSLLFSKSKKLLNFELIIKNAEGITLFEETVRSLVNIEIDNSLYENK